MEIPPVVALRPQKPAFTGLLETTAAMALGQADEILSEHRDSNRATPGTCAEFWSAVRSALTLLFCRSLPPHPEKVFIRKILLSFFSVLLYPSIISRPVSLYGVSFGGPVVVLWPAC